ncbi:glyoxalase [Pseudoalteromonas xiamenensis]|uniref:VOC family protein n=1 Tax=Pseudoalteromonas xiamenensis TaxID=882626 RepID=UPI0027E3F33D|nr:VOC family protein [Pseudoalteromonas xiamenensis]WMN61149.1 glyoxalase [Pseudoalteromonas xiamenensis]
MSQVIKMVIYVEDVPEVLDFYYQAFGLTTAHLSEMGDYGELDTGEIVVGFATHPLAQSQFKQNYIRSHPKQPALGYELIISCTNVFEAYDKAVEAGAEPYCPPGIRGSDCKGYVRAIEGTLIALVNITEQQ